MSRPEPQLASDVEVIELSGSVRADAKCLDFAARAALERMPHSGHELTPENAHQRVVHVVTGGHTFEAVALFSCLDEDPSPMSAGLRSALLIRSEMLRQMKHVPIRGAHHLAVAGERLHLLIERSRLETTAGPVPMSVPLRAAVATSPRPIGTAPAAFEFLRSTRPIGREEVAAVQLLDQINMLLGNPPSALLDMDVRLWPDGQITLAPFNGFSVQGILSHDQAEALEAEQRASLLATKYVWELIEALPEKESSLVEAVANRHRAVH